MPKAKKRRTVGVKQAKRKLTGARKRLNQAKRDEVKALAQLTAAEKRLVKKAAKGGCKTNTRKRKGGKRRTSSGTLS